MSAKGNVNVVCRVRPLNQKEIARGAACCLDFLGNKKDVHLTMSSETSSAHGINKFTFDRVFDTNSQQKDVYDFAARPIIDSVLEGFNGTIFAYGQTSSGKSHTMTGPSITNPEMQGIIPRMVRTVFNQIESASENVEFQVKVSFCEIYNEKIKDLLNPKMDNLKIHEEKGKGVYIDGIQESFCCDDTEVYEVMKKGNENRSVAATLMNAESSRSHSIFVLTIVMNNTEDGSCKTGKLYLVDLAGSEKISKTGAQGSTLKEAQNINLSLTTLGKVIVALTDKKATHIPYRESKLTRILSESLGGNSKTCLIVTASPHPYNDAETLSTLRFGQRARNIKNTPSVNREYTVPELKRILEQKEVVITQQESKIKILSNQIRTLGGEIPDDDQMAKMNQKLQNEEEKKQLDFHKPVVEEEENLDDMDMDLPDRKLTMMGDLQNAKDSILEAQELNSKQNEAILLKNEEIERLQEALAKEKAAHQETRKEFANLKEAQQLAEERMENAVVEKEKFQEKNREYIHKIQSMNDSVADKDLELEEKNAKLQEYTNLIEVLKQQQESTQKKFDEMYENNIFIPKNNKGKDINLNSEEEKQQKLQHQADTHIQEEIRRLHQEKSDRDIKIIKLTAYIKKLASNGEIGSDEADIESELSKIVNTTSASDNDQDNTQNEKLIVQSLTTKNKIHDQSINDVCFSAMLNAGDLQSVMKSHNSFIEDIENFEKEQLTFKNEIEDLKNTLNTQLGKEQPNIKEITDKIVKSELEQQKKRFDSEREQVQKDLLNRVEKVLKLEMQLDEAKDAYRQLESSFSRDDLKFKQKAQNLEKNLDQIHQMYQNVTSEKSILKVDLQVAERKLARKEEKIQQLEKSVLASRQKQQDYLSIIKQLKQEFLKVQSQQMQISQLTQIQQNNGQGSGGKIIGGGGSAAYERKTVIRGGGGKKLTTPRVLR